MSRFRPFVALLGLAVAGPAFAGVSVVDDDGIPLVDVTDGAQETYTAIVQTTEPAADRVDVVEARGGQLGVERVTVANGTVLPELTPGETVLVYVERGRSLVVPAR